MGRYSSISWLSTYETRDCLLASVTSCPVQAEVLLNPPEAQWLESVWLWWSIRRIIVQGLFGFFCLLFAFTSGSSVLPRHLCAVCSFWEPGLHVPSGNQVTLPPFSKNIYFFPWILKMWIRGLRSRKGGFASDAGEKWMSQMFGKREIKMGGRQGYSWEMVRSVTKGWHYSGRASWAGRRALSASLKEYADFFSFYLFLGFFSSWSSPMSTSKVVLFCIVVIRKVQGCRVCLAA